jgi:hypothetical protein
MASIPGVLEGDFILYDPQLGRAQRWSKRAFVWSLLGSLEQFQQQVPGNIIPMQAFVNQFADTMVDGKPAVGAKVISFWQGFAEMTKTLGMFAGGPIADRIGRK